MILIAVWPERCAKPDAKDLTPYAEFLWADYLRHQISAKALGKDFDAAIGKALKLAQTPSADYLPGWCGPTGG